METIGQKQAVINAVINVMGDTFISGVTDVKGAITSEELKQIRDEVLQGIIRGDVAYNKTTVDINIVRKYVNGMVSNHMRKAKELNGGTPYKSTKTGTKRDTKLLNLNRLLVNFTKGTPEHTEIKEAIEARQKELKVTKKKEKKLSKNAIDTSILPAELVDILE